MVKSFWKKHLDSVASANTSEQIDDSLYWLGHDLGVELPKNRLRLWRQFEADVTQLIDHLKEVRTPTAAKKVIGLAMALNICSAYDGKMAREIEARTDHELKRKRQRKKK